MKRPVPDHGWSREVRELYRHDLQECWEPKREPHIYRQYQNQLQYYLRLVDCGRPLRILDVGCAQGTLALLLAERGHNVVAVDMRQEFLDYAMSRKERGDIKFVVGNALELDLGTEFDLVFANQIIEHIVYPERLLAALTRHLRTGGRIVVSTPNASYMRNHLPTFASLRNPDELAHLQFSADGDGHFFAYSAEELRKLGQGAGLTEVRVKAFETPWASGHMKTRYFTRYLPLPFVFAADAVTAAIPVIGTKLSHQLVLTGRFP